MGELADYADFEEIYGGVRINKIKGDGIFVKGSRKSKDIVFQAFDEEWNSNGLDTCSNVAIKIYDKHKNELTIAPSTTYTYTIEARNELYGKPFSAAGILGSCRYIWAKAENLDDGSKLLSLFTPEEEVMVAEMVNRGELTKEEAYDTLVEIKHLNGSGFMAFKAELEEKIGCQILKATYTEKKPELIG